MYETLNHILFGWYPYLCLTVFLVGSWLRFDREQYTWRSGSSQLLRRRQLMWGSNLFHVGILIVFLGHFVGLLTPIWMFDAIGISEREPQRYRAADRVRDDARLHHAERIHHGGNPIRLRIERIIGAGRPRGLARPEKVHCDRPKVRRVQQIDDFAEGETSAE